MATPAISLTFDRANFAQLTRAAKKAGKSADRAIRTVVNKTATGPGSARSFGAKLIGKRLKSSQSAIKAAITVKRARGGDLTAVIGFGGARIPIIKLKAKQGLKGTSFVPPGGKRQLLRGVFINRVSKGRQVLRRKTRARFPIVRLTYPSLAVALQHGSEDIALQNETQRIFAKKTDAQVRALLKGFVKEKFS